MGQPGTWTCLCGTMIYRDELLGPEFSGNAFFSDAVYNCVSRKVITADGVLFRGERAADEQQSEFLGSHDPWFRPATIQTGPDGALWVVDMYRFVIEHPQWINDDLEKTLDLRLGHDRGRIWRVYPADKQPRPIPRLDQLDTAGLVAALDSPSGWQRDMAQMMLVWRSDKAAVEPLEKMAATSQRPLARLHAAVYVGRSRCVAARYHPPIALGPASRHSPSCRALDASRCWPKSRPSARPC